MSSRRCDPASAHVLEGARFAGGFLTAQFRTDKWTFLVDGRVVEWFYEGSSESHRVHVDHFRIDGEPERDGLNVRWGIEV